MGDNRGEMFSQHFFFSSQSDGFQNQTSFFKSPLSNDPELIGREWFWKKVVSAFLHRFYCRVDCGIASDDDGDNGRIDVMKFFKHIEPRQSRHFEIDECKIRFEFACQLQ